MESNQLKTLKIDWLGHCPTCEREQHTVSTSEGNKDYLYEDDTVKCWCGQIGVIETDGQGHAWCNWDEKAVSEWDKFNIYYRQKYPEYWGLLPKANHQACSHHEELFNSWVTAKSQAMSEQTLESDCMINQVWFMKGTPVDSLIKHAEEVYKTEVIAQNSAIKFGTDDNEHWFAHDVPFFGRVQIDRIEEHGLVEWDIYFNECWQGPFDSKQKCIKHLEECIAEQRTEALE